jgi:hypothetical protein
MPNGAEIKGISYVRQPEEQEEENSAAAKTPIASKFEKLFENQNEIRTTVRRTAMWM